MTNIPVQGGLFVGPYEGYYGRAEYDSDEGLFHGEVVETKDVITFVGTTPTELRTAFKESVDDYLAFCKERGESPNKPFSGKFVVRSDSQLHRNLAVGAAIVGKSLNQHVVDILAGATLISPVAAQSMQSFELDEGDLFGRMGAVVSQGFVTTTTPLHSQNVDLSGPLPLSLQDAFPKLRAKVEKGNLSANEIIRGPFMFRDSMRSMAE